MDTHAIAIVVMIAVFLYLGYQGVPVAFALIAGALLTTALFTKATLASIVGQMFNGINQLEFLAIPFFLLTGGMMTSANITERLIRFAQVLVGHFRSGLAHVVSLSSMLFAGISGSMTADVAAISTVVMPYMEQEGYNPAFSAALVAAAATIAAMVPPSIVAIGVRGDWERVHRGPLPRGHHARDHGGDRPHGVQLRFRSAGHPEAAGHVRSSDGRRAGGRAAVDDDGIPAIAIFMPIIMSLVKLGHINPVHMGVLIIVSLAFGLITPPYGLILPLASTLAGVPFTRALRQSAPLYVIFFLVITLIIVFPEVVLWLPRLVIPQSVGCFPNPNGIGYICPPS